MRVSRCPQAAISALRRRRAARAAAERAGPGRARVAAGCCIWTGSTRYVIENTSRVPVETLASILQSHPALSEAPVQT